MEKIIFLVLLAVGSSGSYKHKGRHNNLDKGRLAEEKIVEGEYASITSVPYYAEVVNGGSHMCGASIISPDWLISATHCFIDKTYSRLNIITGTSDRELPGTVHTISRIILHKDYDNETYDNDICLIKVKKPIEFDETQQPIKISKISPRVGQRVKFAGFGDEGVNQTSLPYLKVGRAFVTNFDKCVKVYGERNWLVTNNMFCTGLSKDDTCQGDSGGPLVHAHQLVGIVSWAIGCGHQVFPSVNTQVANYIDWIQAKTGLEL